MREAICMVLATAGILLISEAALSADDEPAVRTAQRPSQTAATKTARIRITRDPFSSRGRGWHKDVAEADRVEFDLYPESDLDFLKQLIGHYTETHGHWHKVTIEPRDPSAFWVTWFKPVLRLAKREFRVGEPIPLTIEAHKPGQADRPDGLASAPWARFNVLNLRIVDDDGNEINPFLYPASGSDGNVRSKVIYGIEKKTIDLTAFVEPYYGREFVYRFKPGTYRVTYYMHAFLDSPAHKIFENRRLGSKTSNTVTFTVIPADGTEPVDLDTLRDQAEGLVTQGKANEAVQAYKRVILHTSDQPTIEKAIRQILAIRRCSSHDGLIERFEKTSFAERMNALRQNEKAWRDLDGKARRLSLLHIPPRERREWLQRWCEYRQREHAWLQGKRLPPEEGKRLEQEREVWGNLHFYLLFHYPQFRPFLEEAVRNPQDCPIGYLKPYLGVVDNKDPRVLRAFLERDTRTVLGYYHYPVPKTPPMELTPFLPAHFDDKFIGPWAVHVFIRAAGLDLRLDPTPSHYDPRPQVSKETVRSFVDKWWRAHAVDFGVTPNADDETILHRLAAIRSADEVVQGDPSKAEKGEEGTCVTFWAWSTIHTRASGGGRKVLMPEGVELTEDAFAADRIYYLCLRRPERGWRFTLTGPDGIWAVPEKARAQRTN